jgi:hypothetical protein
MTQTVSDSRFYMWRSLFAISHADAVVTPEERSFMNRILDQEPFNEDQRAILIQDIAHKEDIRILFPRVTEQQDRSEFFDYARTLVWTDGDFTAEEQKLLVDLKRMHVQSVNFENFEKTTGLSLADEDAELDQFRHTPMLAQGTAKQGFFAKLLGVFGHGKRRWP